MKIPVEVRCIACPLVFCCANCRRAHERSAHLLKFECPICRYQKFVCSVDNLNNLDLIKHISKDHLPLHCNKCDKMFSTLNDFMNVNNCEKNNEERIQSALNEENEVTNNIINEEKEIEDRFNSLYEKTSLDLEEDEDNFEAIVSINKTNKTATITPIQQIKSKENVIGEKNNERRPDKTPHPKLKTTKRLRRTDTPHIKKHLTRLIAQDDSSEKENAGECEVRLEPTKEEEEEISGVKALEESNSSRTPSRILDTEDKNEDIHTTPTTNSLKIDVCATLASAVTHSTPTHPESCQWGLFAEPGADSPLSEIDGTAETASPGQEGSLSELSKETETKKLKGIITSGRSRVESQDSSEKQVTFADSSNTDNSSVNKTKKVKFADDTKFEEAKSKRVFRKPKRMLTPGPQSRVRRITNPHFQALLNRFEHNQAGASRTPVLRRDDQSAETTPAITDIAALPARAIDFKDESPTIDEKPTDSPITPGSEQYKSCIDSPFESNNHVSATAIETFTHNVASSIRTCLSTALQTTDDATEIQFKFTISKKRVSVRRIVEDGGRLLEGRGNVFENQNNKASEDNMWNTIVRAVKSVFWNRSEDKENCVSTTPVSFSRAGARETHSTASKRKLSEVCDTDVSPINHKRYKYARIRGRRPLPRMLAGVSGLKMSNSADQQGLNQRISEAGSKKDEGMNQSF